MIRSGPDSPGGVKSAASTIVFSSPVAASWRMMAEPSIVRYASPSSAHRAEKPFALSCPDAKNPLDRELCFLSLGFGFLVGRLQEVGEAKQDETGGCGQIPHFVRSRCQEAGIGWTGIHSSRDGQQIHRSAKCAGRLAPSTEPREGSMLPWSSGGPIRSESDLGVDSLRRGPLEWGQLVCRKPFDLLVLRAANFRNAPSGACRWSCQEEMNVPAE